MEEDGDAVGIATRSHASRSHSQSRQIRPPQRGASKERPEWWDRRLLGRG